MKTLYIASAGASDPTRASIPLHLAVNGSVEVGHDAALVLVGDAAELLSEETANQIEGIGVAPIRELLAKVLDHGIPVHV